MESRSVNLVGTTYSEPPELLSKVAGGSPGKGDSESLSRVDSFLQESGDTMHHRERFAGSGTSQDVYWCSRFGGNRQLNARDTLLPRHAYLGLGA